MGQGGCCLTTALCPQLVFDYQPGDVFGCVADIGWITGHSYVVYGPLCNGATSVLFESTPVYPNAGENPGPHLGPVLGGMASCR